MSLPGAKEPVVLNISPDSMMLLELMLEQAQKYMPTWQLSDVLELAIERDALRQGLILDPCKDTK
jgi:hypothetical protein